MHTWVAVSRHRTGFPASYDPPGTRVLSRAHTVHVRTDRGAGSRSWIVGPGIHGGNLTFDTSHPHHTHIPHHMREKRKKEKRRNASIFMVGRLVTSSISGKCGREFRPRVFFYRDCSAKSKLNLPLSAAALLISVNIRFW